MCRIYFARRIGYEKFCARWVPHLLTADKKRTHMKISEQCLERFNKNKTDFVRRFITMDETWIHHYEYTPESKKNSKIIFHQDNAPAHKSVLAMGKLRDLHYELLGHPPYSPDFAPSDLCLFPKLKLFLACLRFSSNQEPIVAVEILRRTTTGIG